VTSQPEPSEGDYDTLLRPPVGYRDKASWLKQHGTFTFHYGWQHYRTWTYFNQIARVGYTRSGNPMVIIDTDAGEFLVMGRAREYFTPDLAGQRIYITWWRGKGAKVITEPPQVLTPPRDDVLPPGTTWTLHDYRQRLRHGLWRAGRLRYFTPARWAALPERMKFGCLK
jgi:hypothetical protein